MVLDEDLKPMHTLSEYGKDKYRDYLEKKADEILFKHEHPLKWIASKAKELFD